MKTSLYTVLCIVIRLGAVIIGVELLVRVPGLVAAVRQNESFGAEAFVIFGFLGLLLLVAFLLWLYPGLLARLAAGRSSNQVFESPISAGEIARIAFAVLGAFLFWMGSRWQPIKESDWCFWLRSWERAISLD